MEFHQPRMEIDGWFVMAHCCKYIQKREQLVDLSKLKRAINQPTELGGAPPWSFYIPLDFFVGGPLGGVVGWKKTHGIPDSSLELHPQTSTRGPGLRKSC